MAERTMTVHQQRFLDGVPGAGRALFLDAIKVQALDCRFRDVQVRAKADGTGGTKLEFTGYASVTETPYEMADWYGPYEEIVRNGAFKKTLSESPDTAFLLNHAGATMARTKPGTMALSEDDTGLYVEAQLDPRRSDVQIVQCGIENGELDEMSFAFWITRGSWSPDYMQYDILEVNLHKGDVSVVNYGANPATGGLLALRSRQLANLARSSFPGLVREAYMRRAGEPLAPADMGAMLHVLGLAGGADDTADETRTILAEVLGQPATAAEEARAARKDAAETAAAEPPVEVPMGKVRETAGRLAVEIRAGKTLSASTMDTLSEVLDLIASADEAVDAAQPLLADLMGVPNPDDDGEADSASDGDEPDEHPDGDDEDDGEIQSKSAPIPLDLYTRQAQVLALAAPRL